MRSHLIVKATHDMGFYYYSHLPDEEMEPQKGLCNLISVVMVASGGARVLSTAQVLHCRALRNVTASDPCTQG